MMTADKNYLDHERLMWQRSLNFIQQENVFLKNTIVDMLKSGIDDSYLEDVEYFQNQFLNKDAVIALLRHDIAKQNLDGGGDHDTNPDHRKAQKRHDKLRDDMSKMEKEFSKLKYSFSSYLAKNWH